jgi:hypothetical protein
MYSLLIGTALIRGFLFRGKQLETLDEEFIAIKKKKTKIVQKGK